MGIVDFILNVAALLLWANWRALRFDPINKRRPATLVGALKPITPLHTRHWQLLVAIGILIFIRAFFYWQIGKAIGWSGKLDLGVIVLSFRCDSFFRMLLFSTLSFGLALGFFYLCLLLLSILFGPEPFHKFVRMQLGFLDGWARATKLFLPLLLTAMIWWITSWLFAWLQIFPQPLSAAHRIEEALVIGLGSYLTWKFLVAGILVLHLLNNYIYFGRHPFWDYTNTLAQKLLSPLKGIPLRIGKADFKPVLGIVLYFLIAQLAEYFLAKLYGRLPF
jgi:hypothetical protein